MPEGDTIYRTAARLRPVLLGRTVERAHEPGARLAVDSLAGQPIADVESRGKHLLIHFGNGMVVHGHCGMTGSWHVYRPGEVWRKPARRAGLVLEVAGAVVVFFSPKLLELLTPAEFRRHDYLSRLGPDLLARELDMVEVLRRLRLHNAVPLGEAMMNQAIACGIGNIYKSEMLFLSHLDPFGPVSRFTDDRLLELFDLTRHLMQYNLQGGQRTTRFENGGGRLWVYNRRGQECYLCRTSICVARQGDQGRTTYWCPSCQQAAAPRHHQASGMPSQVAGRSVRIRGCF